MDAVSQYFAELTELINSLPKDNVQDLVDTIAEAYESGRQVIILGNGGSAATASHLACDLQKGIGGVAAKRFRAMSITDNIPIMTAWANDNDYSEIFSRQIDTWVQPGDLVIAISGSGNSPNVIKAVELANEKGATTYGLAGFAGGRLAQVATKSIIARCDNMQQIEDIHMILAHLVYSCLRKQLGC
jgi:D-sedoheptulose 7-phosphate isomerase